MDVKYAYYNTSKGYKVTGGTAAHFLKADGSLDSKEYIDKYSGQTIDSTKTIGFQNTIYSGWDRSSVANPQMGPFSLLNLALQGAYPLYGDEEFREGTNSIFVYNNYGNGNVTMTREAAPNLPNKSGMQLRFNYNGNGATPGLGGFILAFNARSNAVFIQKFMAKLPVGYSFNNAENYMGDNASVNWLTSKAGTGKWETYVRAVICGTGNSFGNGGHVYVGGPDAAMEFCLAFAEIYEVNSSVFSRIKEAFYAKNETIHFNGAISDLITVGDSYAQKRLLSTSWDGINGDQILLRVPGNQNNGAYLRYSQNGTLNGNIGLFSSDNLTGGQIFNPDADILYLGNPSLPNILLQATTNIHFNYTGVGSIYTFNVNGVYLDRNINFNMDNSGVNFHEGGKIYKKAGGGVYINRGTNGLDPRIENADGSQSWMILHEGNHNPFKNLIFTGDLDTVADSGIYRQEGPTSGFSYTTTLNLNSSDGRQQLTIERGGKGMKFRGSNAGSGNSGWSGWNEVYHTGNFNPASYVTQSALNNQLGNYATMAWVGQNYVDAPDGYSVIISGQDLNDIKNTGFYRGSGLGHAPNTGWFFVIVEAHDSMWVKQTVTTYGSGNTANITYERVMSGGAWSAWQKVWTTQDFSQSNINAWNNLTNGITLNQEFTYNTGAGLMLVDDYYGGDSGMIDNHYERFVSGKQNDYYKYGSLYGTFDGLNFNFNSKLFGMGREANKNDKLTVEGSVKASQNFKSDDEKPDTIFIPNGKLATLTDEVINDEKDYAIRLDPHEYQIDPNSFLQVDDRNRLIHIIGEQIEMGVNFNKIYPKQEIVIYNFDQKGNSMEVQIYGKTIYWIEPRCFLRLYVTRSLRVIAERQQPCEFVF